MTFDTAEQNLFCEAWDLLAHNSNYTTLQNLTNLLVAIEKIFVPEKLPEIAEKRRFGGITHDGVYLLSDENEVNKVYSHFALFNKNKQLLNEQMRLEEILNQQETKKRIEATFQPNICNKSEILALKHR